MKWKTCVPLQRDRIMAPLRSRKRVSGSNPMKSRIFPVFRTVSAGAHRSRALASWRWMWKTPCWEALVETLGCSGMTHSAAMAAEILPGKTLLECLNTDLVCDAINVAMREIFKQLAYGRSQTAFSEGGLPIGAGLEDLGKGLRSQVGTMFSTKVKGVRYMEMAEAMFWNRSRREQWGHRLSVRSSAKCWRTSPRHGTERGVQEEHRSIRPVWQRGQVYWPAWRIIRLYKEGGQTLWLTMLCLKAKKEEWPK